MAGRRIVGHARRGAPLGRTTSYLYAQRYLDCQADGVVRREEHSEPCRSDYPEMQAFKRPISPVHFDGHILDGTVPAKHSKIFTPGQVVNGIVRISTNELSNVKETWVEAVGEQVCLSSPLSTSLETSP